MDEITTEQMNSPQGIRDAFQAACLRCQMAGGEYQLKLERERDALRAEVERLKDVSTKESHRLHGIISQEIDARAKAEAEVERLKAPVGFHDVDEFYPEDNGSK